MATIEDYRDEFDPANVFVIPKLYGEGEPDVTFAVQAVGGGEPGEAYSDNSWFYEVCVNGTVVLEGDDLRSGPQRTAEQMAATLADFIAYGEGSDLREARTRIDPDGSNEELSQGVDRLVMYRTSILEDGE